MRDAQEYSLRGTCLFQGGWAQKPVTGAVLYSGGLNMSRPIANVEMKAIIEEGTGWRWHKLHVHVLGCSCMRRETCVKKSEVNNWPKNPCGYWKLPMILNGNFPIPQNCPIIGAFSSRPSWTASQSYGQCSAPDPISFIGQVIRFSHLLSSQQKRKRNGNLLKSRKGEKSLKDSGERLVATIYNSFLC